MSEVAESEVDYLIVGAGAMGMAFADTLVAETNATVAIVDRYHQPGGHWTRAYPFVRLHQPSSFYGVNSTALGRDLIDQSGWNKGLSELATAAEVCGYFDHVLHQKLLPTGRVHYFPMCEYLGAGNFTSYSGASTHLLVRKRIVDATYMNVTVPSMRAPAFEVDATESCIPINDLVKLDRSHDRFVVIGAGKTGIDACLWLLKVGIKPDDIYWIVPRDSWLLDRAALQPDPQFLDAVRSGVAAQLEAISKATSVADLFRRLELAGRLLRLSSDVVPTMYRCATVSEAELAQLRSIPNIVRLGRVKSIHKRRVELDGGSFETTPNTVYIDCTADGLERRPSLPVFEKSKMTLQTIRSCQQVFSAAFIAHVEASYSDDAEKNDLCAVVPHPDTDIDWIRVNIENNENQIRWLRDDDLQIWLGNCRLNGTRNMRPNLPSGGSERAEAIAQMISRLDGINKKLKLLIA